MAIETIHKPGALKQTNKAHKHGKHASKRALDRVAKGKTNIKSVSRKKSRELGRDDRRRQANQIRKNKRQEAMALKRSIGGATTAPFLTCVLPLHNNVDPNSALAIIEGCDEEITVKNASKHIRYVNVPRFRQRFSFLCPETGHGHEIDILDSLKVCDSTILLISATEAEEDVIDKMGAKILNMAMCQGLPTPMVCLMDLESIAPKKRTQVKASVQKLISTVLPDEKIMTLDTTTDGLNLLRRVGGQKRNILHNKSNRPHLFGEKLNYAADMSEANVGTLKVTGFLRGVPLSVNQLVHIPGLGDFQMSAIYAPEDPYKMRKSDEMSSEEIRLLAKANPLQQTSLQRENIPDVMDAEQTWPTEEEIEASKNENKKKLVKRVPKGMSEYQAAWIPDIEEVSEGDEDDDEDDDEDEDEDEEEDYMSCESDTESKLAETEENDDDVEEYEEINISEGPIPADKYDNQMDLDEEKRTLAKLQAAKDDEIYPDEVDTPAKIPAKERFCKYRGLESFRTSPWDVKENLPLDYAKVFQFKNFDRTKRRIIKESQALDAGDAMPGWYIEIHIQNVPQDLWNTYISTGGNDYIVLYGILPHEHQKSVMNVCLKRTPNSTIPIKSKERLIIQCGYRRFIVNPIFSQHTNGDKHKYERFFRPGMTVVATFFAPIQFPPSPVVCFRENPDTSLAMVASGSVINCTPDRVVLKRAVLSGHPFKIHRKLAVIRYMFFNPDDIEYFKPCKLRTKLGRVGHIKESLGTHGHMKCVFDSQLKSHDTVLLYLYKRVFPKWTYEDCVVSCPSGAGPSSSTGSVVSLKEEEAMQE
ncbi:pre-rRNA-processing protein TSR1 homolog isoform X1 [Toxorhynchites rutilus septentrionalis]|uniref:pre-rRNA-processing protein TSR1 homolog isoform X1 n=1 Tax=Toxorhynchites rutilus septentrionalis TaxID=329112 RepID=UPI00247A195E|nr:pre-rRNA-processing protein TSR1 homolog isoform X1 [Toxorhynchites rutilus septentrionalis]